MYPGRLGSAIGACSDSAWPHMQIDPKPTLQHWPLPPSLTSSLILNKVVRIYVHKFDKYGRFLCTIFLRGCMRSLDVNDYMLSNGYGYKYEGGTKHKGFGGEDDNSNSKDKNIESSRKPEKIK